jgi:hypothetical protein
MKTGNMPSLTSVGLCFLQGSASGKKEQKWRLGSGRTLLQKIENLAWNSGKLEKREVNRKLRMTLPHQNVKTHSTF